VTKCSAKAILDDSVACKVHSVTTQCARERVSVWFYFFVDRECRLRWQKTRSPN